MHTVTTSNCSNYMFVVESNMHWIVWLCGFRCVLFGSCILCIVAPGLSRCSVCLGEKVTGWKYAASWTPPPCYLRTKKTMCRVVGSAIWLKSRILPSIWEWAIYANQLANGSWRWRCLGYRLLPAGFCLWWIIVIGELACGSKELE